MTINNFHNLNDESLGKPRLYCHDDDDDDDDDGSLITRQGASFEI
jgi:hypothetical protein